MLRGEACSLRTRPSHTEEEVGLVNLHAYKFEVRRISVGWIWLVDDSIITFLPTKARVHVITTWRIWLTDQRLIQESKRPSFNKLRYSPTNFQAAGKLLWEVFGFTTRAVELMSLCYCSLRSSVTFGTWKSLKKTQVHRSYCKRFGGAHAWCSRGIHHNRHKSRKFH